MERSSPIKSRLIAAAPLAAGIAAAAVGVVAAVCVTRAVLAARPSSSSSASALAAGSGNEAALATACARLASCAGLDIAPVLSLAIQQRSVSFENPDGSVPSLVGLGAPEGEGASHRPSRPGCGCSCHSVRGALTGGTADADDDDGEGTKDVEAKAGGAAASVDATAGPSPAALMRSRSAILELHSILQRSFPLMHSPGGPVERHVVNELSLVYIWRPAGAGPSPRGSSGGGGGAGAAATAAAAAPVDGPRRQGIALSAHLDVVPAADAAEWSYPPFSGARAPDPATGEECVWGRGAIDDKHSVVSLCAAVEALLGAGFDLSAAGPGGGCPYVALLFGHDEEVGGDDGAKRIAEALPALLFPASTGRPVGTAAAEAAEAAAVVSSTASPSAPFSFLLDEGLFLLSDFVPAHDGPIAVVCVGEKGHVNVELSVEAPAGHSSVPGPTTTIGILSSAVANIERRAVFPSHIHPASDLFAALLPGLPFLHRLVLGNTWLFGGLIARAMGASWGATAAMVRTTTAVTLISGGLKSNVLPPRASAVVNHRVHPHETVASVVERDRRAVGDPRVRLRPFEVLEPAPVSSALPSAPGWASVSAALSRVWGAGRVTPAPGLMLGNTDTRHYWALATDIYRHVPTELSLAGTKMFHGKDERVTVANLGRIAAFYAAVIAEGSARA